MVVASDLAPRRPIWFPERLFVLASVACSRAWKICHNINRLAFSHFLQQSGLLHSPTMFAIYPAYIVGLYKLCLGVCRKTGLVQYKRGKLQRFVNVGPGTGYMRLYTIYPTCFVDLTGPNLNLIKPQSYETAPKPKCEAMGERYPQGPPRTDEGGEDTLGGRFRRFWK